VAALALAATIAAGVAVFLRTTGQPRVPAVANGTVIISSHPAGAAVSIDGQPRGVTPVALPMAQGRHTIDVADAVAGSPQQFVAEVAAIAGFAAVKDLAALPVDGLKDSALGRVSTCR
jgi:PEGA domain